LLDDVCEDEEIDTEEEEGPNDEEEFRVQGDNK
jgi:hypothetical protein